MCIDCSGIHRNLGVHISTVKSLTLDKWQPKWVDTVARIGNRIGNEYYENRLPPNFRRPIHADGVASVENFIRAKYERKEFIPKNQPPPHELVSRGVAPVSVLRAPTQPAHIVEDATPKHHASSTAASSSSMESVDLLGGLSPVKSSATPTSGSFANFVPSFIAPVSQPAGSHFPSITPMVPLIAAPPIFPTSHGHMSPPHTSVPTQPVPHIPATAQPVTRNAFGGLADLDAFAMFAKK